MWSKHTSEFAAALARQKLFHQEPALAAVSNILNMNTQTVRQTSQAPVPYNKPQNHILHWIPVSNSALKLGISSTVMDQRT